MFGRNGCLDEAVRAFEDMPSKNMMSWNSIISLFGHHGYGEECFSMFRELMRIEVLPSECTLVGVLSGFVWEDDNNMQVTIAFNHFGESLVQRIPRCGHGYFHVVNNDYTHWEMYAIGGSASSTINSQGYRFPVISVV